MICRTLEDAPLSRSRGSGAAGPSGGQESLLSLDRITDPSRTVSLHAPSLVGYGVLEGRAIVGADPEDQQSLQAGEVLLVPPLQSVPAGFPEAGERPVQWVGFRIDGATVDGALDRVETVAVSGENGQGWSVRDRPFCHVESEENVRRTLDQVVHLFREDPPHRDALLDLQAERLLIHLLGTPARCLLVNGLSRHSADGGMAAAVQYIHDHLDRHISIDELVEEACMSKSTFYRHFSDEFEMSPLEYITKQRVVRARRLLSRTDKTVADISHALGFSSTSYFIDMFKEHVGLTPKQYQLQEEESASGDGAD